MDCWQSVVHKLKNVTLEVTPEEPQQVEVIQGDAELHGLQISDTGQVINSIQQLQVLTDQVAVVS